MKRYTDQRIDKAEIRPEEQSEKMESCRENLWNDIQLKWPLRQKQTQEQIIIFFTLKGLGKLVYVKDINCNIPTT